MKTLVLIRHAKSSWDDPSIPDKERPLNKRGKHDAPIIGARLAEHVARPDLILSSSAVRALTTAQIIAQKVGYPEERITITDDLYATEVEKIISIVHQLDPGHDIVFLFGHNPELTELAQQLTSNEIQHMPTCSVLELVYKGNTWVDLEAKKPSKIWMDSPKHAD